MHRKVPAWFGPGAARKGPVPARHLAGGLPVSRYRRDLEHALRALPVGAPARQVLGQRLDGVLAEQQSRDDAVRDPGLPQ